MKTENQLKEILTRNLISYRKQNNLTQLQLAEKLKSEVVLRSSNEKKNIKTVFNYKIYTNTIKQSYDAIVKSGKDAIYDEEQYDDKVVVKITIPFK